MKFTCPHCGEKTFNPIRKALCGGLSSAGKSCPACGGRCVNGKASLAVNTVVKLAAAIMIFYNYFTHQTLADIFWFGFVPLIASFVLCFLFDMFFGQLVPSIKRG